MQDLIESVALKQDLLRAISLTVLIFGRLIFAIFFTPFFGGGRAVPARIKMGLAGALVAMLYPAIAKTLPQPLPLQVGVLLMLFVKECFVGLVLGLLVSMVFYGVQAAGQFIDNQRGISHAVLFNPALGAQASLAAQFLFQLSVVIFFIMGGHLIFMQGLFHSFEVLPVVAYPDTRPDFLDPTLQLFTKTAAHVLYVSIQLAAPVIIAMFLTEVVLGVANRVAPQMDVLFISYTIKAMTGLIIVFLALHFMVWQMQRLFEQHFAWFEEMIQLF